MTGWLIFLGAMVVYAIIASSESRTECDKLKRRIEELEVEMRALRRLTGPDR